MPLQNTSGNDTTDAYGGGVAAIPNYIENVFSTYLYTGTGASQSIVNGIDLSTKGGLVWLKPRSSTTYQDNVLFDTVRGASHFLFSNSTMAELVVGGVLTAFNANGFDLGSSVRVNASGVSNVAWTFRKQPKFFDVVTYTGTGSNTTVAHNLGSVPGCIIVKRTDTAGDWQVYHNSLTSAAYSIQLDLTNAQASTPTVWNSTAPTSTVFSVGTNADVNASGGTYVAYIFASNAGGFGLTGTDNVISCGSYTSPTSGTTDVNLGYEPQFLLVKSSSASSNWVIVDTMRGFNNSGDNRLSPDTSDSESVYTTPYFFPTATGFSASTGFFGAGSTVIYIAIRRGPMKVPTDATSVFSPTAFSGNGSSGSYTNPFPTDMIWHQTRNTAGRNHFDYDRLRAINLRLNLNTADAEGNASFYTINNEQNLVSYSGNASGFNASGETYIDYSFRRAPSFFDEVCYTGNGSFASRNHNLGVIPELLINKGRNSSQDWGVWTPNTGAKYGYLDQTSAFSSFSISASSSTFDTFWDTNGNTYVAYLFATCAGVSKVGSYTGNGSTQAIACGFTGGARFVLIKRTDSTGDWYVYDTARGMTTLTDPYLLLNSTAAESATLGSVTTTTGGFTVNAAILAAINTSSATYIFLAIA